VYSGVRRMPGRLVALSRRFIGILEAEVERVARFLDETIIGGSLTKRSATWRHFARRVGGGGADSQMMMNKIATQRQHRKANAQQSLCAKPAFHGDFEGQDSSVNQRNARNLGRYIIPIKWDFDPAAMEASADHSKQKSLCSDVVQSIPIQDTSVSKMDRPVKSASVEGKATKTLEKRAA
jgi:hypothetical protein